MVRHGRRSIDAIGAPFDAYGRVGAVARAAAALRASGLLHRLAEVVDVRDDGELMLPAPFSERALGSGLLNEPALLALTAGLREGVGTSLRHGRFPLVYGADCGVLLGVAAAMRDVFGEVGLVCLDGHEDAYPLESSPDGQIADSEIALLLGLTGATAPKPLRALLPLVQLPALALIGPRAKDASVPTLEGRVFLWRDTAVRAAAARDLADAALARPGDTNQVARRVSEVADDHPASFVASGSQDTFPTKALRLL